MNTHFYMVLCDHNSAPPPARHATHAQAEAHAEQLCADMDCRAFVLKAVAVVEHRAMTLTWTPLLPPLPTHETAAPYSNDADRARVELDEDRNADGSLHDDIKRALDRVRVPKNAG